VRCKFRDPLEANRVNREAEFLDAAAQPRQLLLGDAAVFRLCRAAHNAEWARENPAFQQLCGNRLGIVFSIQFGSIDMAWPQ
jgi:hypothetical protein